MNNRGQREATFFRPLTFLFHILKYCGKERKTPESTLVLFMLEKEQLITQVEKVMKRWRNKNKRTDIRY